MGTQAELIQSIYTGFVQSEEISLEQYRPKLLINNADVGQKVLTSIIKELQNCDEFFFSVAFITQSGVTILLNTLKELEVRGICGKIVASQYLNFTDPKALKRLLEFKNIEVKIVTDQNLHAKGYLFRKSDTYSIIVGSSNMTQEALSKNREWNLKISSMDQGSILKQTMHEFEETFRLGITVDEEWLNAYSQIYDRQKASQSSIDYPLILRSNPIYQTQKQTLLQFEKIMPNKMQVKALEGIEEIRLSGEKKTLLISATGTGKTYLSAFDVKKYQPKKFLFLAHREQILNQSIESYQKILGYDLDVGMIGGGKKEINHAFTFSTVFTMAKTDVLHLFSKKHFDYIIIDESHHVGASSYQRILSYFEPDFLLGMTATPERTDGHNIFNDFDYNIAYEIRLQEAMKEEMLCPFHYFGISELTIDGEVIDEKTDFNHLVALERVQNIIQQIKYYGYHGERVKGLVFCSRNDEAQKLSELFNQNGYATMALSGSNSQEEREAAIERLEQREWTNRLDYIFTVDIFNDDCAILGYTIINKGDRINKS